MSQYCRRDSACAGNADAGASSGAPGELFPFRSTFASDLENTLAVSSIAPRVVASNAICSHALSIAAFPSSVSPAKVNRTCTQKTCSEACPSKTSGRTAAGFSIG